MKKTRTKKILTIVLLVVLLVCFFSDIPQSLLNMLSYRAAAETETDGISSVIIKADYSDEENIVLTAVFKNAKNETVDAEDVSDDISYTWYKSTSSYASSDAVPTDRATITYETVTASASSSDNDEETASAGSSDNDEEEASADEKEAQAKAVDKNANSLFGLTGILEAEAADEGSNSITAVTGYVYYVSVTVGGTGGTTLTAEPKYVSTAIADVKIQNDIYRYGVLTALLVNSDGDTLYCDDGSGGRTTYNSDATYTWYHYYYNVGNNNTYIYTGNDSKLTGDKHNTLTEYTAVENETNNKEKTSENTLTPLFENTSGSTTTSGISYYYYVSVKVGGTTYTSDPRIATIYTGITVEIEQKKEADGDIKLNMVIYDDNGEVMYEDDDETYYYNKNYTTTWYKSKDYFASSGDGTTADDNSNVTTDSTAPLGYAPQDYYQESNYMRVSNEDGSVSNTVGYTNTITVSAENGGEVGRYYYVDINKEKVNGTAEAGADPVFVRNCTSTVVIEDYIAEDGTFKAVIYDEDGKQVTDTGGYTFTWYKTVTGTSKYQGLGDATGTNNAKQTSDAGTFISSYYGGTNHGAYYFDSGCFNYSYSSTVSNVTTIYKTSEYDGTSMGTTNNSISYDKVRDNLSDDLSLVTDVFENANYSFNTSGGTDEFVLNAGVTAGTDYNDGSSCNVAKDEGQLRYYYVVAKIGSNEYTSAVKYVKYSNQIENGGFQNNANGITYDSSLVPYWQTTNMGYADSASNYNYTESYYRMRPLIEMGTYITSSNSYRADVYGIYYAFPGLSYNKNEDEIDTQVISNSVENSGYLALTYDDDSTDAYVFATNQFCEINSTDNNTLYQTVMTVPEMPLYWSLSHHARTSTANSTNGALTTLSTTETLYTDSENQDVTLSSLGLTDSSASAKLYVAIDIMYVVIMDDTDAEELLSNGETLAEQQAIIDAMIKSITSSTGKVIQSSEGGISYLERFDGSYIYKGENGSEKTYSDISIWRVQTGSTAVLLTFGTDDTAKTNAEAAAKNTDLFKYYAKEYGTVKSYSYSTTSSGTTTYYAAFYTESQTYSDEYIIPEGQYLSRYFFVAGSSSNTTTGYSNTDTLSFGSYKNENGEEVEVTSYNEVKRATNTSTAGNFIDNIVFTQQLKVKVNYWVYEYDSSAGEWKYVLQESDTEELSVIPNRLVTPDTETESKYSDKYAFTGSYVSKEGGDADTPSTLDNGGNSVLGTEKSFTADSETALVMDLYYTPYEVSIDKEIDGLPNNMDYSSFDNNLKITIYTLTDDGNGGYKQGTTAVIDSNLFYSKDSDNEESLTYSTETNGKIRLEKGTYLIYETTDMLLLDSFDGWYSVEMSLEDGTKLTYDGTLGGFILTVGEDSDAADGDENAEIKISLVNTYKQIAVEAVKSVLFGETNVDSINAGLGSADASTDSSLKYQSLTEYDNALRGVDDTNITDDEKRVSVLSGDTLTYRMELTSGGRADSKDIKVTDIVPSGCTLVDGSIMILKQTRAENTSFYGVVTTILTSSESKSAVDGVTTWTTTVDSSEFKIEYNSNTGEITWTIPEMASNEQYYVEYAVTVNQISSSMERELLTNTAEWSHLSEVNSGATSDPTTTVEATMTMTKAESGGTTTYTVTFSDLNDYTVTVLKDTLPDGFVITTDSIKINDTTLGSTSYTVTYYDSDGQELTGTYDASDIASFKVSYDSGITQSSDAIILTFSGTQTTNGTAGEEIRNMAGITYTKDTKSYTSIVACGEGVTNQVETDVTHLYFEIEKVISEDDPAQTFLFEVAYTSKGGDTQYSYVTINCTEKVTDSQSNTYYTGSTIVQSDVRGTYTITEVTDWSGTDYEKTYTVAYKNLSTEDYAEGAVELNEITVTSANEPPSVTLTLPGLYFTSNTSTFPTALGTLESGTYATVSFTDTVSLYAYLSDQAYSYNIFSTSD